MNGVKTRLPSTAMTKLALAEGRPVVIDGMNVEFHEVVELSPVVVDDAGQSGGRQAPPRPRRGDEDGAPT